MASSEVLDCQHYCEVLTDCLVSTLSTFPHGISDGKDGSLIQEANSLLDLLKLVVANLGKVDVRELNGEKIVDTARAFHDKATKFDDEKNSLKAKWSLTMFGKTIRQLNLKLNGQWNSSLPAFVPTPDNEPNNVAVKQNVDKDKDDEDEPTWKLGDQEWYKLESEEVSHECEDCHKVFTNTRSYKNHCKKKHERNVNPPAPRVKCRLPHTKKGTRVLETHRPDQIATHLKKLHQVMKPSDKHQLRGFLKENGVWSAVFLLEGEMDPQPPQLVPNDPNQARDQTENPHDNVEDIQMEHENPANPPQPPNAVSLQLHVREAPIDLQDDHLPLQQGLPDNLSQTQEASVPLEVLAPAQSIVQQVSSPHQHHSNTGNVSHPMAVDIVGEASPIRSLGSLEESKKTDISVNVDLSLEESQDNVESVRTVEPEKEKGSKKDTIDYGALYLEDELYSSNPENLANEVFEGDDSLCIVEEDSNIEDDDDDVFTKARLNHQIRRYRARKNFNKEKLFEMTGNKEFVEECTKFVVSESTNEDPESSTIAFLTGLMWRHEDSFLHFETNRDPNFRLMQLIDFNSKDFRMLKYPMEWISNIGGTDGKQQPNRRKQMLKSHARIRDFIKKKLRDEEFGFTVGQEKEMYRRDKIRQHLDGMAEDLSRSNIWSKLRTQADQHKKLVDNAKELVKESNKQPTDKVEVGDLNSVYFKSEQCKKRVDSNMEVWRLATEEQKLGSKDFNTFSNWVRHLCFLFDRCREGVYMKITNEDFVNRKKCWFPEGFNKESFQGLPSESGHNLYQPQTREPDAYLMVIPGSRSGLKGNQDATVTLFPHIDEWCRRYQDLVRIMIGEPDLQAPFFISYQQNRKKAVSLTHMTTGRGSILHEFSLVTGVDVTSNSFRRELETKVKSSHEMRLRSKAVTQHSSEVGEAYYETTNAEFRASAMMYINQNEGNLNVPLLENETVSEEVAAKRARYDEAAKKTSLEKAKEILKQTKASRNLDIGKNCKIKPNDREYLQETFGANGVLSSLQLHKGKFPDDAEWKVQFYRIVDGGHGLISAEDLERFREIERSVFSGVRDKAMVDTGGVWENSVRQNKASDQLVAAAIRQSFKSSEKNRKNNSGYFKF